MPYPDTRHFQRKAERFSLTLRTLRFTSAWSYPKTALQAPGSPMDQVLAGRIRLRLL